MLSYKYLTQHGQRLVRRALFAGMALGLLLMIPLWLTLASYKVEAEQLKLHIELLELQQKQSCKNTNEDEMKLVNPLKRWTDAKTIREKHLLETELDLLQFRKNQEYYAAMVDMLEKRRTRLRNEIAMEPAPSGDTSPMLDLILRNAPGYKHTVTA